MNSDSIDKIVTKYFAALTWSPFSYKKKTYKPKLLKVSPLLLRDYTCPPQCGGCCFKFTLDYIPGEDMPKGVQKRTIEFDGRGVDVWSDLQVGNTGSRCRHLLVDGRCGIYPKRPFSCDFELIRVLEGPDSFLLTQKLFGRGWSYPRVDGGTGALCEMLDVNSKGAHEVHRKLGRLQAWAEHFWLPTRIPTVMEIIERGHLREQVTLFHSYVRIGFGL